MSDDKPAMRFHKGMVIRNPRKLEKQFRIAEQLPVFETKKAADAHYLAVRDKYLGLLKTFLETNDLLVLDNSPKSLIALEHVYFELYENEVFSEDTISAEVFETCMHVYFGDVLVAHTPGLFWEAKAHFLTTNAYYLSVSGKLLSICIHRLTDHYSKPNNKKRQALYREFKKFNGVFAK